MNRREENGKPAPGLGGQPARALSLCALTLALAGCEHPEMAATNVYGIPNDSVIGTTKKGTLNGPVVDFGQIKVNNQTSTDLQLAVMGFGFNENNASNVDLFIPPAPASASLAAIDWGNVPNLQAIPSLLGSPQTIVEGSLGLGIPFPVPASLATQLAPFTGGGALTLPVTFKPSAGGGIQTHYRLVPDGGGGEQAEALTGLWFPIEIDLGGLTETFDCDCAGVWASGSPSEGSENPLPNNECDKLCIEYNEYLGIPKWTPATANVDWCDGFEARVKLNRLRALVGLVPEMSDPPNEHVGWPQQLFPGAKDFHLADMPNVRLVVAGTARSLASEEWDDVDADTSHDVAVGVDITCGPVSQVAVDIAGAEQIASEEAAKKLRRKLQRSINTALEEQLRPLFEHAPGTAAPPALCASLPTCAADINNLKSMLGASMTYQKWNWFASPFGPYKYPAPTTPGWPVLQGWLPVTGISYEMGSMSTNGVPIQLTTDLEGVPLPSFDAIVFSFDPDMDNDGIPTPVDSLPTCANDSGDTDGDGIPNDCDLCVYSTDNDVDGDNRCGDADNCPDRYNPDQANCNEEAEKRHTPDQIWGDACDPVPCPRVIADPKTEIGEAPPHPGDGQIWCGTLTQKDLRIAPLKSHPAPHAFAVAQPVNGVPTPARFCQKSAAHSITCEDDSDFDDALLGEADCAPGVGCDPGTQIVEGQSTHFRRITFTAGGNGMDPNGPAQSLSYDRAHDELPLSAWTWRSKEDFERWVNNPGGSLIAEWSPQEMADGLITEGSIDGTLWLHASTLVGDADNVGTGIHGEQLANHHKLGFRPQYFDCQNGLVLKAEDWRYNNKYFLMKNLGDPGPDDFRRWDGVAGETSMILPIADEYAAFGVGTAKLVTNRLMPLLQERLADPTLVWTNAVEALAETGAGPSFPLALALAQDGSQIVDTVTTDGNSLYGDLDLGIIRGDTMGSHHALDFVPVLTRTRRGIFVVGGDSPVTGDPTREIWFTTLDRSRWNLVRSAIQPEKALAATYSYATDDLYVLDETAQGEVRLFSVDFLTFETQMLGRWARDPDWDRHWLLVDPEGRLLLASTSTSQKRHAIARIDVRAPGVPVVDGIVEGHEALVMPPIIDGSGVTRVIWQDQRNPKVELSRVPALSFSPTTWYELGAYL